MMAVSSSGSDPIEITDFANAYLEAIVWQYLKDWMPDSSTNPSRLFRPKEALITLIQEQLDSGVSPQALSDSILKELVLYTPRNDATYLPTKLEPSELTKLIQEIISRELSTEFAPRKLVAEYSAVVPARPYAPNKKNIVTISAIIGLLVGLGLAQIREKFSN